MPRETLSRRRSIMIRCLNSRGVWETFHSELTSTLTLSTGATRRLFRTKTWLMPCNGLPLSPRSIKLNLTEEPFRLYIVINMLYIRCTYTEEANNDKLSRLKLISITIPYCLLILIKVQYIFLLIIILNY
jgi:hypothetical protein